MYYYDVIVNQILYKVNKNALDAFSMLISSLKFSYFLILLLLLRNKCLVLENYLLIEKKKKTISSLK